MRTAIAAPSNDDARRRLLLWLLDDLLRQYLRQRIWWEIQGRSFDDKRTT